MQLSDPFMHSALVGNGMIGLDLVRIPEGVRDQIVEILYRLIFLLSQILEADAQGLGRVFWCISLEEFLLKVIPLVFVEGDVLQRVLPGQGVVSQG